jgi:hypothetical protein
MSVVNFTFHADTTDEQRKAALDVIQQWPEVRTAALLKAGAKNPVLQRMAFVQCAEPASAGQLVERLRKQEAVASASVPAMRSGLDGAS